MCWLTLHAGTVFFIGEKEGRISHESLTALSFYVVGGNMCFTLYLAAVYARAAFRESRTGGVAEQRRKSQRIAAKQARRQSLNAALGARAVLQKAKSMRARELLKGATVASEAAREALVDKRSAATKRLRRRLEVRTKMKVGSASAHVDVKTSVKAAVEPHAHVDAKASAKTSAKAAVEAHVDAKASPKVAGPKVAGAKVAGAKTNAEATADARLGAIADWQSVVDPKTGSTYYYNTETGESSWARPVH